MIGYLTPDYALIAAFGPKAARRTRRESLALNRVFKSAPKLADYFRDEELLATKGPLDRPISGLAIDSRRVAPGNLFFALPGRRFDGAAFIDQAVSRGAVAVVTQAKLPALPPAKVTFIQVDDARAALAAVAQRYFKFPDRDMTVVGVTGTNGKTTVAHLLKHFLNGDQLEGLVGKLEITLRHLREGAAGGGDMDVGDARGRAGGNALGDDGHGPALNGLVDEGVAVGPAAREREEEVARHHAAAVHREAGDGAVEIALAGEDLAFGEVVGELGGHLEDARADAGFGTGAVERQGAEGGDERIVGREVTDHRTPPCIARKLRVGAVTGLMSRYWMSCSAMCLNAGAATTRP